MEESSSAIIADVLPNHSMLVKYILHLAVKLGYFLIFILLILVGRVSFSFIILRRTVDCQSSMIYVYFSYALVLSRKVTFLSEV